jgi:hypothetical protein
MKSTIRRWRAAAAAILCVTAASPILTACSASDDEEDLEKNSRMMTSPYVGVWVSSRFLESRTSDEVLGMELRDDGSGCDGIWNVATEEFTPEDYTWYWYVEDDRFNIVDNGYTISRPVTLSESGNEYTIYDEEKPKYTETYIKMK